MTHIPERNAKVANGDATMFEIKAFKYVYCCHQSNNIWILWPYNVEACAQRMILTWMMRLGHQKACKTTQVKVC